MESLKMGVIYVVAHLIITVAIIAAYVYTLAVGTPDETLKMALIAIIGYWFGALGKDNIKEFGKKKGA
jgi:hypothetical protein